MARRIRKSQINQPIIFKIKKMPSSKEIDLRQKKYYYRNTGPGGFLEYITRGSACFKENISAGEFERLKKLKESNSNDYQKEISKLQNQPKTSGVWGENGLLDDNQLKTLKKDLHKIDDNQHIWNTVISFSDIFSDEYYVNHPEHIQEALKVPLKKLFKENGMDYENMNWFFSFHNNTDNPHIHLAFFEKKPTYPKKYNKKEFNYRYKYNLDKGTQPEFNKNGKTNPNYDKDIDFKLNLEKEIKLNSLNIKINNDIRDNLIFNFRSNVNYYSIKQNINSWNYDREIFNDIRNNYNEIIDKIFEFNRKIKLKTNKFQQRLNYNSKENSKSFKTKIDKITDFLINQNPETKNIYEQYLNEIKEYQKGLNKINGTNNNDYIESALYGKDGLYSRLGNHILKAVYKMKSADEYLSQFSNQLEKQKISIIEKLIYMIQGFLYREGKLTQKLREKNWKIFNERNKRRKE